MTIATGQIWASNDGKRVVQVTRYDAYWDDCRVKNLATGRHSEIFGDYLRRRYLLVREEALAEHAPVKGFNEIGVWFEHGCSCSAFGEDERWHGKHLADVFAQKRSATATREVEDA